jgi:hypothetical protein
MFKARFRQLEFPRETLNDIIDRAHVTERRHVEIPGRWLLVGLTQH